MTKKGLQNAPLFFKKGEDIFFILLIIKANFLRLILTAFLLRYTVSKY